MPRFSLNSTIAVGGFLLDLGRLDSFQTLLQKFAPRWGSGLHVRGPRQGRQLIDVSAPGSLTKAVRARATERGALFRQLASEHGEPRSSRVFGQAELAGADPSLVVVISIDTDVLSRAGANWIWGNRITLQVGRSKVEGVAASIWVRQMFEALCDSLSPYYGHAETFEECEAKNISHDDGGTQAVGVDVSRYLPGLYWLNFLGEPYCELIGTDRVLKTPCPEVRRVDRGVLLALGTDPRSWNSEEYRVVEGRAREHLGQHYFFSREHPDRQTVSPNFGFSG